jgi:ParB-like chromosome segregation protein Spo0J
MSPRKRVPTPETVTLPLDTLYIEDAIYPRAMFNPYVVEDYATLYREEERGDPFPPLDVFVIDGQYYVVDGVYRLRAAQEAGRTHLACRLHRGTWTEALLFAIQANLQRGHPYGPSDKIQIVTRLLELPAYAQTSDREMCRWVGMSKEDIRRIRHHLDVRKQVVRAIEQSVPPCPPQDETATLAAFLEVKVPVMAQAREIMSWFNMDYVVDYLARQVAARQTPLAEAKAVLVEDVERAGQSPAPAPHRARRRTAAQQEQHAAREQAKRERAHHRAEKKLRNMLLGIVQLNQVYEDDCYSFADPLSNMPPDQVAHLRPLLHEAQATLQALQTFWTAR